MPPAENWRPGLAPPPGLPRPRIDLAKADRADKHYGAAPLAGTNNPTGSLRVTPANPKRISLLIQNTGANPGLVRFEEPIQGNGSDLLFAAGAGLLWDKSDACPVSAINVGSELGTSFAIVETTRKDPK